MLFGYIFKYLRDVDIVVGTEKELLPPMEISALK